MTPAEQNSFRIQLQSLPQDVLEQKERTAWEERERCKEQADAATNDWLMYRVELRRRMDDARIVELANQLAKRMTAEVQA